MKTSAPPRVLLILSALAGAAVQAQDATETVNLHAQFTEVVQGHPSFRSPYEGENSLKGERSVRQTSDLTLYAGLRLAPHSELYLDGELDQGFGLSNTLGLAGYASGEAYKVGRATPYAKLQRAFLRQSFEFGGEYEALPSAANQLGGGLTHNRLTLSIGKYSVTDLFDTNRYAHDPRGDFLNWSLLDAGAFDYAADAWGYSYGGAAEWQQRQWTLRGGVFAMSRVPNSPQLEPAFKQFALIGELEHRHQCWGEDGALRLTAFDNRGRMARYDAAVAAAQRSAAPADVSSLRQFDSRPGAALNLEQALTADLGLFTRLSANDGSKETFEFTDINRSLSGGLSLQGSAWQRAQDSVGLAAVVNELSGAAQRYFAAGGMGLLIGDGQLPHYGSERIAELYYRWQMLPQLQLSADGQYVENPAYNRDRGPVRLAALRLHVQF